MPAQLLGGERGGGLPEQGHERGIGSILRENLAPGAGRLGADEYSAVATRLAPSLTIANTWAMLESFSAASVFASRSNR